VEQELSAGLGERQVAEFVEDKEVEPGQMLGQSALASIAGLGLEPVDQIDDGEEAAAAAIADAGPGDGDGKMGLSG
jgi:hypothetical protein